MTTRETLAARILRSAERLNRLLELNAPEIVLEGERMILFKALLAFPVNAEAQSMHLQVGQELRMEEEEFLQKHGYYDDVMKLLDDPQKPTPG